MISCSLTHAFITYYNLPISICVDRPHDVASWQKMQSTARRIDQFLKAFILLIVWRIINHGSENTFDRMTTTFEMWATVHFLDKYISGTEAKVLTLLKMSLWQ